MAKSARATSVKKNRSNLKKKVFGPVEAARNERLSAKLLELANQAKPPRPEMEVDDSKETSEEAKEDRTTEDVDMDADATSKKPSERSNRSFQRQKAAKAAKVEKRKHTRKPKNSIVFKSNLAKKQKGKKK